MAQRAEIGVVFGAGLVQGVALVTFPAISSILTDPAEYGLSGVGALQDQFGLSLATLYSATAVVAVVMGLLSFVVVRGPRPLTSS